MKERPWDKDAAFAAGKLLEEMGKDEAAKAKFIEIIYHRPMDAEARCKAAGIEIRLKNYNNAVEQLNHVIKTNPSHPDANMMLGDAYFGMGDAIRGIFYYRLAADYEPDSLEKHMRLAAAYAKTHSWDEAGKEFKKSLELASTPEEELMVYREYRNIKETDE